MQTSINKTKFSIIQNINIIKKSKNKSKIFLSILISLLIVLIVAKPNLCINSIYNGLSVWAKCVVPSLLPFMFFTRLLTNLNFISKLTSKTYKLNKFLFNAPKISSYIFLMSIISGYPIGAKLISEYHKMGIITTKQANKLCTFCSTSGPLFIIGSVGTALLLSAKLGYIMLISHIFGSVLNGILYRKFYIDKTEIFFENNDESKDILQNSMKDSILSVLVVGGYIAIAFLVIDLFNNLEILSPLNFVFEKLLNLFGIEGASSAVSSGILEVSKGAVMLSKLNLSLLSKGVIASFLIGFGGISVFLQGATFLTSAKVNMKFYLLQKLTHGILSAVICFVLCVIFKIT